MKPEHWKIQKNRLSIYQPGFTSPPHEFDAAPSDFRRDEVSWYDDGSWHDSLRGSDGLKPQPRRYLDIDTAPDQVKSIYHICLPHYQHMHQFRISPDGERQGAQSRA